MDYFGFRHISAAQGRFRGPDSASASAIFAITAVRASGSVNTYYAYDAAGQLMAEYGGAANPVGTQYLVQDYLGSTRLILNAQGGCQERIDYTPFGGQVMRSGQACYASGAATNLPLFTGQMRDGGTSAGTETDLDYFSARYFWGSLGRFTSPDEALMDQYPGDPQSWNLYSYVRSNPLNFTDPTGRCKKGNDGKYHDSDEGPCVVHGETSVTVTEKAPRVRDHAAEVQAEMTRLQYEAWKRNQERNKPKEDQPLRKEARQTLELAYERTVHDIGCVALGYGIETAAVVPAMEIIPSDSPRLPPKEVRQWHRRYSEVDREG